MKVIKRRGRDKIVIELISLFPEDERFCEITLSKKNLSVHHIVPKRKGGNEDLDNLMVLTKKIHKIVEKKSNPLVMEIYNELIKKRKLQRQIRTFDFNIEKMNENISELREEYKKTKTKHL